MDYSYLIKKVENLESALAFQEKLVADLNAIVIEQQAMLDALAPKVREIAIQLGELKEKADNAIVEKPPHY